MAKRFTETTKWSDPWFVDLNIQAKTLFCFLCDFCDIAGFYERHDRLTAFYTGIQKNEIDKAYKDLQKSVIVKEKWVFVKNFIKHQKNLPLNPKNGAHIAILRSLVNKADIFGELYPEIVNLSIKEIRGVLGGGSPPPPPIGIGIGIGKGKSTHSIYNNNSKNKSTGKKITHPPYVSISKTEQIELLKSYRKTTLREYVEKLNDYAAQFPERFRKYKSHGATIKNWIRKDGIQKISKEHNPDYPKEA